MKQHIQYYKHNDEIYNTNYKSHYVCFDCKIAWKSSYASNNTKCIKCNNIAKDVGINFRVPKKYTSDKDWKKLEILVKDNHIYFQKPSCESMICHLHKHIYWQGNLDDCDNCKVPYCFIKSI